MSLEAEHQKKRPRREPEAKQHLNSPESRGSTSVAPMATGGFDNQQQALQASAGPRPWPGAGQPPIVAPAAPIAPWDAAAARAPGAQPTGGKGFWFDEPPPAGTSGSADHVDQDKLLRIVEAQRDAAKYSVEKEKIRKGLGVEEDDRYAPPRELLARSLDQVSMRAIEWLWTGWIPKGYVTIWAGETGAGKSTVLAYVTATITTGAPWPGNTEWRPPGRVLWLGSEDGIEELTVPRLVACCADLRNVTEIQGVIQHGKRSSFSMQDDLQAVRAVLSGAAVVGQPFSMLVIDPVTSYLPGRKLRKVDLNDAGQLRTVLEPWLVVAQEFNLAIVCVTHFMKDTTRAMLHRVLGSAAFAQTCRSLCAVVARPDEDMYAKALIQVKVNLPDHPGGAWKFRTQKVHVGTDAKSQKPIFATSPVWEELDPDMTPESVVGGTRGPVSKFPAAFGPWLRAFFVTTPPHVGLKVADVKAAAINAGVVTARWWDEHSSEYLDKQNIGGIWQCRPKGA